MPLLNGRPITVQDDVRLFWPSVRRDVGYVSDRAVQDRPRFTRKAILERLTTNERWLSPHMFGAQLEKEFDFLGETEKERLVKAVEAVRAVSDEIPAGGRPTTGQLDVAREPFADVVELMGFDRYDEADDFYLGKQIEQRLNPWPPHLDHLRFRTGFDSAGDPALWVWGYVAQTGEYDAVPFLEWASDLRRVVDPICREFAPEGRAFVRFRSTAEQDDLEGVAA